jgi:uncharacterized protein
MRIPTVEECYELMKCHAMLPHIIAHSEQVARVAVAIMNNLKDDADISRKAVIVACLLHDITKTRSLQTKEHHDLSGGLLLEELGFPTIGAMVKEHVVLQNLQPEGNLLAKEIVYYSDKRVKHDQIVTVEERVSDLIIRYGTTEERIRIINSNAKQVYLMELKIRRFLNIDLQDALAGIDSNSRPHHWL